MEGIDLWLRADAICHNSPVPERMGTAGCAGGRGAGGASPGLSRGFYGGEGEVGEGLVWGTQTLGSGCPLSWHLAWAAGWGHSWV